MDEFARQIEVLNSMIFFGFAFGALLVTTYFKYEKSQFFTMVGDIFIKFSFIKRDKRDLLMFAMIPIAIGGFALIFRLTLVI